MGWWRNRRIAASLERLDPLPEPLRVAGSGACDGQWGETIEGYRVDASNPFRMNMLACKFTGLAESPIVVDGELAVRVTPPFGVHQQPYPTASVVARHGDWIVQRKVRSRSWEWATVHSDTEFWENVAGGVSLTARRQIDIHWEINWEDIG